MRATRQLQCVVVPLWLHQLFTLLALAAWLSFALWADLGAVVASLGSLLLLALRNSSGDAGS